MYLLEQIEGHYGLPYQSISPVLAENVGRVVFARQMEDRNILGSNCLSYTME
jgi:c-di-GMP-binding flagellar brake protein YcgR